jgi:hypothetical protein
MRHNLKTPTPNPPPLQFDEHPPLRRRSTRRTSHASPSPNMPPGQTSPVTRGGGVSPVTAVTRGGLTTSPGLLVGGASAPLPPRRYDAGFLPPYSLSLSPYFLSLSLSLSPSPSPSLSLSLLTLSPSPSPSLSLFLSLSLSINVPMCLIFPCVCLSMCLSINQSINLSYISKSVTHHALPQALLCSLSRRRGRPLPRAWKQNQFGGGSKGRNARHRCLVACRNNRGIGSVNGSFYHC